MWKQITRIVSPGGLRGRLVVLFLHRVFERDDDLLAGEPTAESFGRMLGWLKSQFNVLPLGEAVRRLDDGTLPPCAASLTFDDGYRDNLDVALPLLQRHGVPCTVFVAARYTVEGGLMFSDRVLEAVRAARADALDLPELGLERLPLNDWPARRAAAVRLLERLKYLPPRERDDACTLVARRCGVQRLPRLMMDADELRRLSLAGVEIGAHTDSHPILAALPDADAETEITQGRRRLEALLDRPVPLFAYPNGRRGRDYDDRHVAMAQRAGFAAAFSTEAGVCRAATPRHDMPRFTPWARRPAGFRAQLWRQHLARHMAGDAARVEDVR